MRWWTGKFLEVWQVHGFELKIDDGPDATDLSGSQT
jgi:hypothetical protein